MEIEDEVPFSSGREKALWEGENQANVLFLRGQ